jgi:hypothetical protein
MWTDAYSSYFVFTYGLFKDAVKSWGYIASNGSILVVMK